MIDVTHTISVIVALIAALSAYASSRASAKAATQVQSESSRVDMEKNAYERARAFDTETIARQNRRIAELVEEVKSLEDKIKELYNQFGYDEDGLFRID